MWAGRPCAVWGGGRGGGRHPLLKCAAHTGLRSQPQSSSYRGLTVAQLYTSSESIHTFSQKALRKRWPFAIPPGRAAGCRVSKVAYLPSFPYVPSLPRRPTRSRAPACRRTGKPDTATDIVAVGKVGRATHATATVTSGTATVATATVVTATGVDHGRAPRALASRSSRASGGGRTSPARRRAASAGGRAATASTTTSRTRAVRAAAARHDGASDQGARRVGHRAGHPRRCPRTAIRTSRGSL